MIYCIWYPSGGFGHFINGVLSLHGENFVRPADRKLKFSNNGNSHSLELIASKYYFDPENYNFNFDDQFNYSVLVDNGINNENERFKTIFPTAHVIKICYNDQSWPIVAQTMIDKAMQSDIDTELSIDQALWHTDAPWALREKYFLFLRDHVLRRAWKPTTTTSNLLVNDMFDYFQLTDQLRSTGILLDNFQSLWNEWFDINRKYVDPVINAQDIIYNIKNSVNTKLNHITDIWEQAVLYYFIWLEFNSEVPHNDYAYFFTDTDSIRRWLHQ